MSKFKEFMHRIDFELVILVTFLIISILVVIFDVTGVYDFAEKRSYAKMSSQQRAERLVKEQEKLLRDQKKLTEEQEKIVEKQKMLFNKYNEAEGNEQ